jgi:hypothetical protein
LPNLEALVTAECISPIQGTRARITRLDLCGAPVLGAGSVIVFDGFVEVLGSPQYEDGTEYRLRNAQGVHCVKADGDDQFLRDDVDIRFCAINPDAVVITTGQELIVTGAGSTGTGFWVKEGAVSARWGLEVWAADPATCTGIQARYAYWAWPHLGSGRLTDFAVRDDVIEWRIQAKSKPANTAWGNGPGSGTAYINQVPALAHRGFNIVHLDPPAVTDVGVNCGAATLS